MLLAFGLGVLNVYLEWDGMLARMRSPYPIAALCGSQTLYFGAYALLIWLISRRGSAVARGIFALLALFVGFLYLATLPPASTMTVETVSGIAQSLLTIGSLGLIFGRDTEPWFRGEGGPVDPEIFR